MTQTRISLDDQIASVEREIAMRQRVYPSWVAKGKMKQEAADLEIARMEAASVTLNWLRRNEDVIRKAVGPKGI